MTSAHYLLLTEALIALGRVRDNETAMQELRPQERAAVCKSYNSLAEHLFGGENKEEVWKRS